MSTEVTGISAESLAGKDEIKSTPTGEPWPAPAQAWYAVFVFALSLLINFLDRGIVTLLVAPIKRDLHLTDTEMGLVMGFAFVFIYMFLGLPVARLVDFKSRRAIMGVGITIWSFTTALCGLAHSFWQLFICRVGVGVGEACSGPATYSMLADLFPKEKLPRAIAVLNFGFYAGSGLALIIGGTVTQMFLNMPPLTLPLIGTLRGWQLTFFVVGIPGLLVAALMSTVSEPKRRGRLVSATTGGVDSTRPIPIKDVLTFMRKQATTFLPMFLGMGLQTVMAFGTASWAPEFYRRTYGWTVVRYGLIQGLILVTVLPLGAFIGSLLAERFARAGRDDANMLVVFLAKLISLPASILFPLMPNAASAIVVSALGLFCLSWVAGPLNAALQIITPNQMRGQITALFLFVFNVIGFGLGSSAVAFFTDYVFRAESQIGYSLSAVAAILGPLGALVLWLGLKPYGRSVAASREWS